MVKFLNSKSSRLRVLRMQLLFDSASKKFLVWYITSEYDPSSSDRPYVSLAGDFISAKQGFVSNFKTFTGVSWDDRHSEPIQGNGIYLEISHKELPIMTSEVVSLPKQVEDVLRIIFESSSLAKYAAALKGRGRNVSFEDKRKKRKCQIGIAVLKRIQLQTHDGQNETKALRKNLSKIDVQAKG
jgi:hypothetical protein